MAGFRASTRRLVAIAAACWLGCWLSTAARAELRLNQALDADPYVSWTQAEDEIEVRIVLPELDPLSPALPGFGPFDLQDRRGADDRLPDGARSLVRYARVPLDEPTATVRLLVDSLLFADGTTTNRTPANTEEVGDSLVPRLTEDTAPRHPVLLESTGFDGSQRLAYLQLTPLLLGLEGRPDRVLVEARGRLLLEPLQQRPRSRGAGLSRELGTLADMPRQSPVRARVSVTERGIQHVTAGAIREVAPELLLHPGKELGVVLDDKEQACRRILDADGFLLALEFIAGPRVGEGELDVFQAGDFTDTESFFIQHVPGGALTIEQRDAAPRGAGNAVSAFRITELLEEDSFFYNTVPEPSLDHWSWGPSLKSDGSAPAHLDIPLSSLLPMDVGVDSSVHFRVTWHGRGLGSLDRPHRTQVAVGSEVLSTSDWHGFRRHVQLAEASAGDVVAAGSLRLTVPGLPGTGEDAASLDTVSVSFNVPPLARHGLFDVHAPSGLQRFRIEGFSGPELRAFDLSEPSRPIELTGLHVAALGVGYGMELDFDGGLLGRPFLASGPAALRYPPLTRSAPEDLLEPRAGADWLVILPAALESSELLPEWVAARRASGLRTRTVKLQDVFDLFSFGRPDPRGIEGFLRHVALAWPAPRPSFVVLLGDGSKDYKGTVDPDGSVLPAMLYDDPAEMLLVGHHAGDARAAAVLGPDLLPEFSLGRIPVRTPAELDAVLAKILRRESSDSEDWGRKLVVARGTCEDGDCFGPLAAELVDAVPSTHAVVALGSPELAAGLLPPTLAAGDGTNLVLYLGHGGIDRWSPEDDYFGPYLGGYGDDDPSVADLARGTNSPLFVDAGSVLTGAYQHQALSGLQEELLLSPDSGSVGGLSASAHVDPEHGREIARATIEALFGLDKPKTLGELGGHVRRALDSLGGPRTPQAVSGLTLLGDPAMPLQFPVPDGPTALRAVATDVAIGLYWNEPATPGPRSSYRLYRSDEAAGPYLLLAGDILRNEYHDDGVLPERAYHYRVTLVDEEGHESSGSNRVVSSLGGGDGPIVHGCLPNRGGTSGGERILIIGENFLPGATGSLDGVACLSSTWLDSERLECLTPPNVPGLVDAAVVNPDLRGDTAFHAYVYCLGLSEDVGGQLPLGGAAPLGSPAVRSLDALGRWQPSERFRPVDPALPGPRRGFALKPIIDPGITRWPIPSCD